MKYDNSFIPKNQKIVEQFWFVQTLQVRDNVQESISQLEKLLAVVHNVRRPQVKCFQMLNEKTDTASHDWNASTIIQEDEVICQVSTNENPTASGRQNCLICFDLDLSIKSE